MDRFVFYFVPVKKPEISLYMCAEVTSKCVSLFK